MYEQIYNLWEEKKALSHHVKKIHIQKYDTVN